MSVLERFLLRNPLDIIARQSFGLPKTAKGFLATHQNPRPAGIVMRNCTYPISPWPWEELSDGEFAQEMRHNNGHLISVLLRHPEISNDHSFLRLFDAVETEYVAALGRSRWAFRGQPTDAMVSKVFERMKPVLFALVDEFVEWSVRNRQIVCAALDEIMSHDEFQSGNAMEDIKRLGVDWL